MGNGVIKPKVHDENNKSTRSLLYRLGKKSSSTIYESDVLIEETSGSSPTNNERPEQTESPNYHRDTPKRPNMMFNHSTLRHFGRQTLLTTYLGSMKWKKGELIGSGAFGKVYMGLNEQTGSIMAVKEMVFSEGDAQEIEIIEREIDLLRSLSHENIVHYLGTESTPRNVLYIFTEWVPGGSLQQLQKKFGPLSENIVMKYTAQILKGLEYLHENHVIHRDIKGANVLVDDRGTIKLTDFGASKRIAGGTTVLDENQSLRGTPYYMAPEVIMQTGHGRKADIWSVGCTVLQMLTGQPPWKDLKFESSAALLFHIAHAKKPPTLPDTISETARSFLNKCLQMDPNGRSSATELLTHPFLTTGSATEMVATELPPRIPVVRAVSPEFSSSCVQPREFVCDVSDSTEPSICISSPKAITSTCTFETDLPVAPIARDRKKMIHKSTELLRQKRHENRRHSHNRIQVDELPPVELKRKGSYNKREEVPIGTNFAQKQREQELLDIEKKRQEKVLKEQQWKAELAAYRSGEL